MNVVAVFVAVFYQLEIECMDYKAFTPGFLSLKWGLRNLYN